MGLTESKHKGHKSLKQNGEVKKSKTLWMYNDVDVFASPKKNDGAKTLGGDFENCAKKENSKKIRKIKVFSTKKLDSNKVTSNSGHKSNHGKTREDQDQKNKWTTIPRSAHSTIERLIKSLDYQIVEFNINIDERSSILAEKASVLKYKTPHFRAKASVIVPKLEKGDQAVVGWIQVVNSMIFVNRYGDHGLSSWEFPELTTGRQMMISDSDGHRYPWYGSKKEVAVLKGPTTSPTMLSVIMNDNFSPQVTWFVPAPNHRKTCKDPKLTRVFRKQSFTACLAVMKVPNNSNLNTQTEIHQSPFNPNLSTSNPYNGISILRAIKWELKVDIIIDPTKPIGQRSTIPNGYLSSNQYFTINDPDILADILDLSALHPPNANKSQTLIWRPFTEHMLHPSSANSSYSYKNRIAKPSPSVDNLNDTKSKKYLKKVNSSSFSLNTSTTPQASQCNGVLSTTSKQSINSISHPYHKELSQSKDIMSSSSPSSTSSDSSSPFSNSLLHKDKLKFNSSISTDQLIYQKDSFDNPTHMEPQPNNKSSSYSTLLSEPSSPQTSRKQAEGKKCRVVTNDRNKGHLTNCDPVETFRPLKVETIIVQPMLTNVQMDSYLSITKGLSSLLHKCVANETEH